MASAIQSSADTLASEKVSALPAPTVPLVAVNRGCSGDCRQRLSQITALLGRYVFLLGAIKLWAKISVR